VPDERVEGAYRQMSGLPRRSVSDAACCLNLVEIWFGIIERQVIHCGTFASIRELMIKIHTS
jgi:hypothetical protein